MAEPEGDNTVAIQTCLEDQGAVVTGASRGIGRAIARRLALEGARVVVTSRDRELLGPLVSELCEVRAGCAGFALDVRREDEVRALVDYACRELGEVHVLVNNAGVFPVTPLLEISFDEWERVTGTNLDGPFLCSRLFAERMIRSGTRGRIVNVSSTASRIARPGIAHYGASKAGLNMLTRIMAVELAPFGIRVNAVCPGVIETETTLRQAEANPAEHEAKLRRIPLGRLGKSEEVASAVLFLVSEEAAYLTGACLFVDGGYSLGLPSYR